MNWGNLRDQLSQQGYVVLATGCTDLWILEAIAAKIGHPARGNFEGEIGEVVSEPGQRSSRRSIAYSPYLMFPHTDGSFEAPCPSDILLQCVMPDADGYGTSLIIPLNRILAKVSPGHRVALSSEQFTFGRSEGTVAVAVARPVLEEREHESFVRYREDDKYTIESSSSSGAEALSAFRNVVRDNSLCIKIHLTAGDVLWLDNQTTLHGRTKLSGRQQRVLRRMRLVRYAV